MAEQYNDDIVPELLEKLKESIRNTLKSNDKYQELQGMISNGNATYANTDNLALEYGNAIKKAMQEYVSSATLPDGKMYYNIADRVFDELLTGNYDVISEACIDTQTALNTSANIGLRAQTPTFEQDRIDGLKELASNADQYDNVKKSVENGMVNFSQSIVDNSVKKNAEFQSSLGMHPRIVRKASWGACEWCLALVGSYDYPDDVPDNVYHRHENCNCTVEYYPGDGKRQDVWSKTWRDAAVSNQSTASVNIASVGNVKDFNQFSAYMKTNYNIDVDSSIQSLSIEAVKNAMYGVEEAFKEFPEIASNVTIIKTGKSGIMACTGNEITFNPSYFDNTGTLKTICQKYDGGWFIKNVSPASIGYHDCAHVYEQLLINANPYYTDQIGRVLAWNDCTEAKKIVSQACKNVKKTAYGKGKKNSELIKAISEYAATNSSETLAESFADVYNNSDKANPLAKEIKKLAIEQMNLYKGSTP